MLDEVTDEIWKYFNRHCHGVVLVPCYMFLTDSHCHGGRLLRQWLSQPLCVLAPLQARQEAIAEP